MFKRITKFRLCFCISICCFILYLLYMTNSYQFLTTLIIKSSNVPNQEKQTRKKALDDLIDIVGTIPRFTPSEFVMCPKFPTIFDLHINNDIWQVLETTNGSFYLFGAYYDDRKKNTNGPSVRIIGMANRLDPIVPMVCQLWHKHRTPMEVPVANYKLIWNKRWGVFDNVSVLYPYLITCDIPMLNYIPDAVSLVEHPCDIASNNLIVNNNRVFAAKKKDFLVCVKGLDFPFDDYSVRLIEWIELLKLFGVDKIVFYNFTVHRNIEKVLNLYKTNSSFVEVTPITIAGKQLNFGYYQHYYLRKRIVDKRFNELIAYNDCFYKNMHEYKYIALLDIDEIIVPTLDQTWLGLIQRIRNLTANFTYSSFSTRNVYFLDSLYKNHKYHVDIPNNMHMLQHIYRTKYFTKSNYFEKCFHDTEEIVTLHNHFPIDCFTRAGSRTCNRFSMNRHLAQLNHYRENCKKILELGKKCQEMMKDTVADKTLWRFKEALVKRVVNVAKMLGLSVS